MSHEKPCLAKTSKVCGCKWDHVGDIRPMNFKICYGGQKL